MAAKRCSLVTRSSEKGEAPCSEGRKKDAERQHSD